MGGRGDPSEPTSDPPSSLPFQPELGEGEGKQFLKIWKQTEAHSEAEAIKTPETEDEEASGGKKNPRIIRQTDLNFLSGHTSCVTSGQQPNLSEPHIPGRVVERSGGTMLAPWLANSCPCSVAKSHLTLSTPWTIARKALLSSTFSQSLLKLMSMESVMLSNYLILLLLPPIFPNIRVFSNESALRIRWPKYSHFSFSVCPSKELISFRIDWFDLLTVQGTLKSSPALQHKQ